MAAGSELRIPATLRVSQAVSCVDGMLPRPSGATLPLPVRLAGDVRRRSPPPEGGEPKEPALARNQSAAMPKGLPASSISYRFFPPRNENAQRLKSTRSSSLVSHWINFRRTWRSTRSSVSRTVP